MTTAKGIKAKDHCPWKERFRRVLPVASYLAIVFVFFVTTIRLAFWFPISDLPGGYRGGPFFFWCCIAGVTFVTIRVARIRGVSKFVKWPTVLLFFLFATAFLDALIGCHYCYVKGIYGCRSNLRLIGETFQAYHDQYGHLPPVLIRDANEQPQHSWRGIVLKRFIEEKPWGSNGMPERDYDFSQPWDAPDNRAVLESQRGFGFVCGTADLASHFANQKEVPNFTSYLAVTGENTAWLPDGSPRSLAEISDPANTAMIVELTDSDILVTEPKDITLNDLASGKIAWSRVAVHPYADGLVYPHPGANILFADGSVRWCIGIPTEEEIRRLFSIRKKTISEANCKDKSKFIFGDRSVILAKQPIRAAVYYTWWTCLIILFIASICPRKKICVNLRNLQIQE